jgi:phenylpropionate dioxygenase-like ring-hydroxylating dioxygenase large terminal subunit
MAGVGRSTDRRRGFVFINPDVNAQPLEEFLGPVMIAHYEKFNFAGKF